MPICKNTSWKPSVKPKYFVHEIKNRAERLTFSTVGSSSRWLLGQVLLFGLKSLSLSLSLPQSLSLSVYSQFFVNPSSPSTTKLPDGSQQWKTTLMVQLSRFDIQRWIHSQISHTCFWQRNYWSNHYQIAVLQVKIWYFKWTYDISANAMKLTLFLLTLFLSYFVIVVQRWVTITFLSGNGLHR